MSNGEVPIAVIPEPFNAVRARSIASGVPSVPTTITTGTIPSRFPAGAGVSASGCVVQ